MCLDLVTLDINVNISLLWSRGGGVLGDGGGGQIVNPQPPPHFLPLLDHIRQEVLLSVCRLLALMVVRVFAVARILNSVIDAFIVAHWQKDLLFTADVSPHRCQCW